MRKRSIWGYDPGFEQAVIAIANTIKPVESGYHDSDTLMDTLICTARKVVLREMEYLEAEKDWPTGGPR